MGQNHIENNIYNGIDIDKDLNQLMKQEKNILNNKNDSEKLNDLIKRNIGNNFTRSNFKNNLTETKMVLRKYQKY